MAKRLQGVVRYVKIGTVLFTAVGPAAIRRLRALGFEVFLDLKFHDIPSTVEKSCRAAVRHQVWMLTVHACGQQQMLEAAAFGAADEARRRRLPRPRVVGVTVLTSVASTAPRTLSEQAIALARDARHAGLDGVVCSADELAAIRRRVAREGPARARQRQSRVPVVIVCPGIRPPGAKAADQRRVVSPREAIRRGADFLVVGRPITQAADPRAAAHAILADMEG